MCGAVGPRGGGGGGDGPSVAGRVFVCGAARFTVLTPAIVRLEHDPARVFEDRPTLAFPDRSRSGGFGVAVRLLERPGGAEIDAAAFAERGGVIATGDLEIRYDPGVDGGVFTARSLSVALVGSTGAVWRPGDAAVGNLGGTVRTLDHISGSTPLERGLVSRDGWSVYDDSGAPVLTRRASGGSVFCGEPFAAARGAHAEAVDWYFFGHGRDYRRALGEFAGLSGPIPLPPRWVFGVWWSRYWRYTDTDLKELAADFERHGVPLDVLVIDMDWHLPGWTGYTWDRSCFPDPEGFLSWCHHKGLRVALNLHPADGVGKHEAAFDRMRAAVGGDRTMYRVPFDCTDPVFMSAYFEHLHRPLEAQGVDFWWMDWQQGSATKVEGLDPLAWLNHLHWRDMELNPARRVRPGDAEVVRQARPLVLSRWGGLGGHRYPIGFSGDTFNDWASLAFQPGFTATASNVCFGYWSHDIGGHQPGPVAPELYARWIQFGVLSPIVRTHAGNRADAERRVWAFGDRVFGVAREALSFRYALVPYIYAACREAYDTGVSLCRPMYYEHAEDGAAYEAWEQYFFGPDMIAAPAVSASDAVSGRSVVRVWLPCGVWTEWFTGVTHEVGEVGGRWVLVSCPLEEIPLFVRGGAVVPTVEPGLRVGEGAPERLWLEVFPFGGGGGSGERVCAVGGAWSGWLYDDDGVSEGYERGECVFARVAHERDGRVRRVRIGAAEGSFPGFPARRDFGVRLRESVDAVSVSFDGEAVERIPRPRGGAVSVRGFWYEEEACRLVVALPGVRTDRAHEVSVELVDDPAGEVELRGGLRGRRRRAGVMAGDGSLAEFCAWYGVWCSLTAEPDGPSGLSLAFEVHHVPDDPGVGAASFEVSFDRLRAFEFEGGGLADTAFELGVGESFAARASARAAGGVPGNDTLRAGVSVCVGGETRRFDLSVDLCPSVNGWHATGPFSVAFDEALRLPFGPEVELLETGRVDLSRSYADPGAGGPERDWLWVQRPGSLGASNEFVVDLNEALGGPHAFCVAYAATTVFSPRDVAARLVFGSDDGAVIWVNGREVFRHHIRRGFVSREQAVACDLRAGENQIVVKVSQAEGGWMFAMHIEDASGRPIPGLRTVRAGGDGL